MKQKNHKINTLPTHHLLPLPSYSFRSLPPPSLALPHSPSPLPPPNQHELPAMIAGPRAELFCLSCWLFTSVWCVKALCDCLRCLYALHSLTFLQLPHLLSVTSVLLITYSHPLYTSHYPLLWVLLYPPTSHQHHSSFRLGSHSCPITRLTTWRHTRSALLKCVIYSDIICLVLRKLLPGKPPRRIRSWKIPPLKFPLQENSPPWKFPRKNWPLKKLPTRKFPRKNTP